MQPARPYSVGVLEDDDDLRAHLTGVIEAAEGLSAAFAAATLAEANAQLENGAPDICLIDIQLPDGSGLNFASRLKAETSAKVLILTVLGDKKSVLQALSTGADGYLLKDTPAPQIEQDIECAIAGDAPISPQAARHLLRSFQQLNPPAAARSNPSADRLTDRETEILCLFAKGLSYRETARTLGITHNTVGAHVKAIYSKLNVKSRGEAVFEAGQLGWLDRPGAS